MSVKPLIYQELREFYFMRFLLVQIAKKYPCKRILCMVKLPLQCNERGIYMFWFLGVLAGLLLSVADIFLLTRKRNAPACIIAVLRDTLVSNLASLGIMSLILKIPNVLLTSAHGKWYPLKYFVFVLAVGLVFLFGRGVEKCAKRCI